MNYVKDVAEMLDLEWDDEKQESEEFKFKGVSYTYKLTENGIVVIIHESTRESRYTLDEILTGEIEVEKLPWRPNPGEVYYIPDINTEKKMGQYTYCTGNSFDERQIARNLHCKTKEEAIEKANQALKLWETNET